MTAITRQLLIAKTAGVSASDSDQTVMDAYLGSSTRAAYELASFNTREFYAVLATAEYHEHWDSTASADRRAERDAAVKIFHRAARNGGNSDVISSAAWNTDEAVPMDIKIGYQKRFGSTVDRIPQ